MLLSELLKRVSGIEVRNFRECEVCDVTEDSREVSVGAVFVARRGVSFDGNSFLPEAIARGACAVLTEKYDVKIDNKTTIISKNASKNMAEIAKALCGDALCDMTVIGITGTKGKTSTLEILASCIRYAGLPTVCVGTLGAEIYADVRESYPTENTTPTSPFIYKILHRAHSLGVNIALLEVSSQALAEFRVYGIPFDVCIFTNLSPDHVGVHEHASLEEYIRAKHSLFCDYGARVAVVNGNDRSYGEVSCGCPRVITVGTGCEYGYEHIRDTLYSTEFSLAGRRLSLPLGGEFNGMNASLALVAASVALGREIDELTPALSCVSIPGRYEVYTLGGVRIVIDFAHNAKSLAAITASVCRHTAGKIILVFGSVGERCHARRAELAAAAESLADLSVITSDNPGSESPRAIAEEIYSHFSDKERAVIITDREEAILYAIRRAKVGDSVLLLGKGQEDYQLTADGKVHFSEREVILGLGAVRAGGRAQ